ncbi:hypothetical protein GCM10010413_29790 [Promicromonospora sukumoe]|uniref:Uncharacterized protein n=1 Tax=Promicromonospora sukumoe TaxID=88382 RepID=A0A7W3J6Q3_9MICO|nr:hypothetical protein [Promicromonospora sukumoe]MBA8807310.1 hypothetical protein [Promicromonospora sukumoe]
MSELTPDELAEIERRFENFDVDQAEVYDVGTDELPPQVVLVRAMAERELLIRQADHVMRDAVGTARAANLSWHKIGMVLGTTGEAARQRYAKDRTAAKATRSKGDGDTRAAKGRISA